MIGIAFEPMRNISIRSLSQRRMTLVVILALTLWVYSTASDLLYMYYQQEYMQSGDGKIVFADMSTRWVQHLLLLPLFVTGYLAAGYLFHSKLKGGFMWTLQILIGFLYALSVRPMFFVAVAERHGHPGYYSGDISLPLTTLVASPPFIWIGNTTTNFAIYLLGLLLMAVFFSRLDLMEERLRLEKLSSEWLTIKLRTLQWQLNPHFLFNSLNTVSSLLRSSPSRADQVLAKFSDLLRMTLKEQENLFSQVNTELEYIHRYLDMEKVRFEDRLRLSIEADEAALKGQVPSLLLQPLIENAIKHGVARIPGIASVEVNVNRRGAGLVLEVRNSSPGGAPPATAGEGSGLGIRNLRERLATIYADSFRFKCSHDGEDTWISTVEIPYSEKPPG